MAEPVKKIDQERRFPSAVEEHRGVEEPRDVVTDLRGKSYQAYQVLHVGFTIAPILAGVDKYFHFLANWDNYLAPLVTRVTGLGAHTFMLIVGAVEIVAGIGVAVKPRIFGYVVSLWLLGIVVNLLFRAAYYDIALRDFGLCLAAFALARLSGYFDVSRRNV